MTEDALTQHLIARYGAGVTGVSRLGVGFETEVWGFTLPGGAERVVRLIPTGPVQAEREFWAMRRLRNADFPIPEVFDEPHAEMPSVTMARVHGQTLDRHFWPGDESRRRAIQTLLMGLHARLHALPAATILPDDPLATSTDPHAAFDREMALLATIPAPAAARDWLTRQRKRVPCPRTVPIHGDFHRNNVMLDGAGAPWVIDWSNARVSDPRVDLGWARVILSTTDANDIALYEAASEARVERIEAFEVLACARVLGGAKLAPPNPDAADFLRGVAERLDRLCV